MTADAAVLSMDVDAVIARINGLIEKDIGSETQLSKRTGVPQTTVNRALNPSVDTRPTTKRDRLRRVIDGLVNELGYSEEWLLSGTGGPGKPRNTGTEIAPHTTAGKAPNSEDVRTLPDEHLEELGLSRIKKLNIEVSAGDGSEVYFEEVNGEEILPAWFVRQHYGIEPQRLRIITVRGNSMTPTLKEGEEIKVVIWDGEPIRDGMIYVLRGPSGLIIKRIEFEAVEVNGDVEHKVWVKSDNPDAESYRVPKENFERDFRVLAYALEINKSL